MDGRTESSASPVLSQPPGRLNSVEEDGQMARPQITLRYEIMTVDRINDEVMDAPDGWESMTDDERNKWCEDAIEDGFANYIATSYDWTE